MGHYVISLSAPYLIFWRNQSLQEYLLNTLDLTYLRTPPQESKRPQMRTALPFLTQ